MKRRISFFSVIAVTAVSIIILVQCAVNPVTGKKEFMLLSESAEIALGQDVDRGIRQEYGIYNDPALNAYVVSVGQKLSPYTHRSHLQYHFAILDTPVQNAFAAPGGYIYITRGLMSMMNSEAELAVVLGHELGHVNARHSARAFSRNILFSIGLVVASELSEDIKKIAPYVAVASQLLFLKFSRSDEYQADSLGVEYSRKSRYKPGAMVSFFTSIDRLSTMKGGGHLPNFLSTHPLTPRRIEQVKQMLLPADEKLTVNRNSYLRRIDGMIYGSDPRQGYVERNHFYHPGLRFSFQIPYDWKVQNTPMRVTLASKDGQAAIVFSAKDSSQDLDNYSQETLKGIDNLKVISNRFTSVNAFNAFETVFNIPGNTSGENKSGATGWLTCIRKGGTIFSFLSIAGQANYNTYRKVMTQTINSFRNLKNASHLNRRPAKVHLKLVQQKQTLKSFLQRQRIPPKNWPEIALINLLQEDSVLVPNQLVKLIY